MSVTARPSVQFDPGAYRPEEVLRISEFYQPWPKQIQFHASGAKARLEIGGYGSGKSRPLLMEAVFHAMEYPGSNSIILRKTIPDLKRTVIDKFKTDVPKRLYERGSQEEGTYNETDHIVYWPPVVDVDPETGKERRRQSKIFFAACEKEADVGKYLSTEFVFIGFEELGEFSFAIWDALAGRNRCPIPGSRPCMAAATNPMGIGWSWIKKLWIDKLPAPGMNPELYRPEDYEYIHSTVDDNPIYIQDTEYVRTLEASPMRERIRWGKLDAVSGQYFDNWEPKRHVRTPSDFVFESWRPVWVGYDYGFSHYACIVFWTKAVAKPRWEGDKPRVVNVTIKELVLHESTPEQQAHALIQAIPRNHDEHGIEMGYRWEIESIHLSWERFNRTVSNRTVADEIGDILSNAGLPRPVRSNTDRVAGWQKMYSMLDNDEWYVLGEECPTLVEALPLLVRGDGVKCSLEDIVKPKGISMEDDVADAARYGCAGVLLDEGEKPKEQVLKERLAAIKDPLARHVQMYREYNKELAEQRRGSKQPSMPSWMRQLRGK